jgi:hypothetical protein
MCSTVLKFNIFIVRQVNAFHSSSAISANVFVFWPKVNTYWESIKNVFLQECAVKTNRMESKTRPKRYWKDKFEDSTASKLPTPWWKEDTNIVKCMKFQIQLMKTATVITNLVTQCKADLIQGWDDRNINISSKVWRKQNKIKSLQRSLNLDK